MRRAVAVLLMIAVLFFAVGATASIDIEDTRQELKDINAQIKKTQDELVEIQEQQEETENEIENISEQQTQTKGEIEALKDQQEQTKNDIEAIEVLLVQKEHELNQVEHRLETTQNELEDARAELERAIEEGVQYEALMADRVRMMYMNRASSYLELLLEARSINELADRIEIVRQVIAFDQHVLEQLEVHRERVHTRRTELENRVTEIIRLKEIVSAQKMEIEQTKNERSSLLAELEEQEYKRSDLMNRLNNQQNKSNTLLVRLEEEEREHERQLDELERTSIQIERRIQDLIREQEQRGQRTQLSEGQMAWPVPGFYRVSSPFGYRVHPVFRTRRMHAGIDIGSNITDRGRESIYGQNFVAAADGVVLFAGWFGGYGNCVIIDHGGNITTLYAHGSLVLVSEGQQIRRGQPVMTVGSTGISTGPHAHFEVREDGVPVDPMRYLRGR